MNLLSFHHKADSVSGVKRDRLSIGSLEPIFLYINMDQIGSSMICMAKPASSHSIIKFTPNSHHYECKDLSHKMHTDQVIIAGAIEI